MAQREKSGDSTDGAVMSEHMRKSCIKAIGAFGYTPRLYEKFLESVKAMNAESRTVYTYPNEAFEKYREKFVKPHEAHDSLGDLFMFEKAKVQIKTDEGHWRHTGRFVPRIFWDYVMKIHGEAQNK